jgi:hypothetical protein
MYIATDTEAKWITGTDGFPNNIKCSHEQREERKPNYGDARIREFAMQLGILFYTQPESCMFPSFCFVVARRGGRMNT